MRIYERVIRTTITHACKTRTLENADVQQQYAENHLAATMVEICVKTSVRDRMPKIILQITPIGRKKKIQPRNVFIWNVRVLIN